MWKGFFPFTHVLPFVQVVFDYIQIYLNLLNKSKKERMLKMMLKTGDVSRILEVSRNTVRRLVKTGDLPCSVMPSGMRLFKEDDVSAFQREKVIRYQCDVPTESGITHEQCEQSDINTGGSSLRSDSFTGGMQNEI